MNLVAYDNVNNVVDKQKTWIDASKKVLLSREIACRKYVCFGKKYDSNEGSTIFYIIVLDDAPLDRASCRLVLTNNGCRKINLKSIWDEANLSSVSYKYFNIILKPIEHTDDGDVYELVVPT